MVMALACEPGCFGFESPKNVEAQEKGRIIDSTIFFQELFAQGGWWSAAIWETAFTKNASAILDQVEQIVAKMAEPE